MIEEKALQMTAKWKQYSKEELQKIADKSNSAYEFYKALGYTGDPGGKGLKIAKDNQLDISHWTRHIRDQLQENEKIKIKNQIYTRDELQDICNECRSYTAFAAKLGYVGDNKALKHGKRIIAKANLNCEHFTGQGWNRGNFDLTRFRDYTNDPENKPRTRSLYDALEYIRGHKCENPECGKSEHCGKPIPLEIHHKDANRFNNTLDNLELLCPTCHAMTENYRGRNTVPEEQVSDEEFAEALKNSANIKEAIDKIGCTIQGSMYNRARRLIEEYDIVHLQVRDGMLDLVRSQSVNQNKEYKNARARIFDLLNACIVFPTDKNKKKLLEELDRFIDKYSQDAKISSAIKTKHKTKAH